MARISMPTWPDDMRSDAVRASWGVANDQHELATRARPRLRDARPAVLDAAAHHPVQAVMRFPICIHTTTPLARAVDSIVVGSSSPIVVVDDQRHPLGVVTAADVFRSVSACERQKLDALTVLDAATPLGASLSEQSSLACAARRFAIEGGECLVAVSADGRVAGIVVATDILHALAAVERAQPAS